MVTCSLLTQGLHGHAKGPEECTTHAFAIRKLIARAFPYGFRNARLGTAAKIASHNRPPVFYPRGQAFRMMRYRLVAKCFNGNNGDEEKPRTTSKCAAFRLLRQDGAFLVVLGQPIGPSQLELQPPRWGGEPIVPDGFSRSIRPSAAVADLVEAIWDWDIPDGDAATGLTIKIPPSTAPYFVVQYRTLTHCRWNSAPTVMITRTTAMC